ncbi:MAG: glycosyltransferase [Clostridiales bacterium]|nr:glycosyltransferase [Clostridiales bacterium]
MKILQLNSVYGVGSTGKITRDIHRTLLRDGFESIVCYGRGKTSGETGVIRICSDYYAKANNLISRATGLKYGGCIYSTRKIEKLIQREKPDVVHLQCINGYFLNIYRLVDWLKKCGIPTVLTLHAEFMFTANCDHAFDCERWKENCGNCPRLYSATKSWHFDRTEESFRKMYKSFQGFEALTVVSVSPWLMHRAESSPILSGHHHCVILNGVDTEVFYPRRVVHCPAELSLAGKTVILHVTASFRDKEDDPKGGWYVLQAAKRLEHLPFIFLVAGKFALSEPGPDNVLFLGEILDQNILAEYYSMADLTILTSKRETFSMVCAESLCCGTPVVGFCAGGPESVSLPEYSQFVPYGDTEALTESVKTWSNVKRRLTKDSVSSAASRKYAKEHMVYRYEEEYRGLLWNYGK